MMKNLVLTLILLLSSTLITRSQDRWYTGKIIMEGVEIKGEIVYYFQTDNLQFRLENGEIKTYSPANVEEFEYIDGNLKKRRFISLPYSIYSSNYQSKGFFEVLWESPYLAILSKKEMEYTRQTVRDVYTTTTYLTTAMPKKAENSNTVKREVVYIVTEEKEIKGYLGFLKKKEPEASTRGTIIDKKLLKEVTKEKYPQIVDLGKKKKYAFNSIQQLVEALQLYSDLREKESK
jgi:hypothetical protein